MPRKTAPQFMSLYEKACKIVGSTGQDAYDLAERLHKHRNGTRHYKNFESFRSGRRHQRLKRAALRRNEQ